METRKQAAGSIVVDALTDGILDPGKPMLGPVKDGGEILAHTAPGCWGPMITPGLKGGHEVTQPVYVDGAGIGDAVVLEIKEISVTSVATASGHDSFVEGHFNGDPYVAKRCPQCGTVNPKTRVVGIGQDAIHCAECDVPVTPFRIEHGYTVVFDEGKQVSVTVNQSIAERIAKDAKHYANGPGCSIQHSVLLFAPHDLVGTVSRLRPFMGQLGTMPAITMPDSHNAGDFGTFLVGAPHAYALTEEQLELRTDGHMDIDAVRVGAIVIAPVKVQGAGVYMGDMHALQGDGEIAGHTMDVSGKVKLGVSVLKGLELEGPIILPVLEDLPFLARPFTAAELEQAETLAKEWGVESLEQSGPISVVGTGADLNKATENGLQRAAKLLGMTVPEVRNRATINGAIEIGRHPGVVQVTFLVPFRNLQAIGLLDLVRKQYSI